MADEEGRVTAVAPYSGGWWCNKIEEQEKELDQKWRSSAVKAINRYMDNRQDDELSSPARKYNIFWANVQILKSALYANPPKASVTRENGDSKDDAARVAALMLQRILHNDMTKAGSETHASLKSAVEDRLLPGLGQVWLRYEPTIEEFPLVDQMTGQPVLGEDGKPMLVRKVTKEKVCTDYVNWRDFIWSPSRRWEENWWVARRLWMGRKKFEKRWGAAKWKEVKGAVSEGMLSNIESTMPKGFKNGKAMIFEVWCETTGKVYWVSPALSECLEDKDDPLGLDDFWPCPCPLLATHTNESLIPKADYTMVQDQYEELDVLNNRISILTKALRVVGVYDKDNSELGQMLTGSEFNMIPVENWAVLSEQGGITRAIEWFPVDQIAKVLGELIIQRQGVIAQIYELTSISDIMRGASNPRETAKAQSLKAQYSSVRLQLTQQDVAGFVQQVLRLRAEIIGKHFQPESIIEQSQIMMTDSASLAEAAVQVLKDFKTSEYRIEVSEESLSMADYTAEREMRVEMITAIGQFFSQAAVMIKDQPQAMPYLLRMVQWVIASFRGSSDIETVIDEAIKAAQSAPPQSNEPPAKPDHSEEVAQIRAQNALQIAQMDNQAKAAIAQLEAKVDIIIEKMKAGISAQQESEAAVRDDLREQRQAEGQQTDMQKVMEAISELGKMMKGAGNANV